jgi:aqualysin 1
MKDLFLRFAALSAVFLVLSASGNQSTAAQQSQYRIPDQYIVVLHDSAGSPQAVANEHAQQHSASVNFVYEHALRGYAARIPAQRLAAVQADSRVKYVEEDGVASIVTQTIPWGITQVGANVSSTKAGNGSGAVANVNVYILDTGIGNHSDLNKAGHVNFAGGKNDDCNGHGTHVAGTVGARDNISGVVGVAPGVALYGVKVLGCSGSGSWSGIIKGIDWVTGHDAGTNPKVANMSLGGGKNTSVDTAVANSAAAGVVYALAAGNSGADACNYSPAAAGRGTNGIITTAATDSSDKEASWSNYGSCVDTHAPGVGILSTKMGGGTTTMSGTSMASPHVAGAAALYLSQNPTAGPDAVESAITVADQETAGNNKSKDGSPIERLWVGGF